MKNLFVVLLFVLFAFSAQAGSAQTPPSHSITDNLLNTELQLLGDKTLKLSEYSGKVVLINLFATWCGPCRLESPDLAKLHNEFKDRGLVVIELSTEDPETSKKSVRDWVWDYRLPYPVGWATREFALTLMQGRSSIPQAFVIAPDGRIVRRFIGYNPEMTLNQMREAVKEAMK